MKLNKPTASLRVLVADDEPDTRQFLTEVLAYMGYDVTAVRDGTELVEKCCALRPDLVITDIQMPSLSGLEAVSTIQHALAVPVIFITGHPESDLLQNECSHVMACLSKPIKPADLMAAIILATKRFDQFRQLSSEAAGLRQALEDRKIIERAKGNLMNRLQLAEEEAFHRLQIIASKKNIKLVDIARQVIAADEIYQQFDSNR